MRKRTGAESPAADPLDTALPFGVALGHRVRQVREESARTANEVAGHARTLGLGWGRSTVTHIELGQRQVTAAELLVLPLLFNRPLAELLPTERCALNEDAVVDPGELRSVLTAPPRPDEWDLPRYLEAGREAVRGLNTGAAAKAVQRALARYPGSMTLGTVVAAEHDAHDEATAKAARKLDVDYMDVAVAAHQLWNRGLPAERDARLAPIAVAETARRRQARRGHITRTLLDELRPAVEAIRQARGEGGADT